MNASTLRMRLHAGLCAALLPVLLAAAAPGVAADETAEYAEESRKAADQLLQTIRGELLRAMETSGPLRAMIVCKYSVPEITSNMSRSTGWKVTRVALKPRNPALASADAWEQRGLLSFEQRAARGDKAETLEQAEIVSEPTGRYFRYMRALTVLPLCLNCHGPTDAVSDATRMQLAAEYPKDVATGYKLGQVRGAVTIKRPLPPQ
jgi:hypothetical protein